MPDWNSQKEIEKLVAEHKIIRRAKLIESGQLPLALLEDVQDIVNSAGFGCSDIVQSVKDMAAEIQNLRKQK